MSNVRSRLLQTEIQELAQSQEQVLHRYGMFMVTWSILDGVVQAALMKQLQLDPERALIVTTSMQFRQRVAVLSSLLRLLGSQHQEAIALLQKLEKSARRNALVHGHIVIGVPGQLTFVKSSATAGSRCA